MEGRKDFVKGCVVGLIIMTFLAGIIYGLPVTRNIDAMGVDAKVMLEGKNVELKGEKAKKPELLDFFGTLYLPAASVGTISGKTASWDSKAYVLNLGKALAQDKAPAVNKKGNTCGNITNGGFAAQQGDWVYFNQFGREYTNKFYKMKLDGSNKKLLLNESVSCINVLGDWIYYSSGGIYKMKTDGSGRKKLSDDIAAELTVEGSWIYYRSYSDGLIYKMKTDGKSRTKLCGRAVKYLNLSEGWLYYADEKGIWKIKTDGKGETRLYSGSAYCVNVSGQWIYFSDSQRYLGYSANAVPSKILKVKIDGTGCTVIDELDNVRNMNVCGDWIYIIDRFGVKLRTDGTERTLLGFPSNVDLGICVIRDWLFYGKSFGSSGYSLSRMRIDGSEVLDFE